MRALPDLAAASSVRWDLARAMAAVAPAPAPAPAAPAPTAAGAAPAPPAAVPVADRILSVLLPACLKGFAFGREGLAALVGKVFAAPSVAGRATPCPALLSVLCPASFAWLVQIDVFLHTVLVTLLPVGCKQQNLFFF